MLSCLHARFVYVAFIMISVVAVGQPCLSSNYLYFALRYLLCGVVFGLTEYLLHRFVHQSKAVPHSKHHKDPRNERTMLVQESSLALYATIIFLLSFFGFVYRETAASMAWWYYIYEVYHACQHNDVMENKHHFQHHKNPSVNFGVTTTGWDVVMNTHAESRSLSSLRPHEFVPILALWNQKIN